MLRQICACVIHRRAYQIFYIYLFRHHVFIIPENQSSGATSESPEINKKHVKIKRQNYLSNSGADFFHLKLSATRHWTLGKDMDFLNGKDLGNVSLKIQMGFLDAYAIPYQQKLIFNFGREYLTETLNAIHQSAR